MSTQIKISIILSNQLSVFCKRDIVQTKSAMVHIFIALFLSIYMQIRHSTKSGLQRFWARLVHMFKN